MTYQRRIPGGPCLIQLIKQLIIADESINQETSSSTKQSNDDLLSSIQNSQNQSSFMKSVGKS